MTSIKKAAFGAFIASFLGVGLLVPFNARASEAGRRNTTWGLGAVTAVLAAKHQWVPAAVTGIGTAVAYHNYQAAVNARHRHEQRLAMRHSYRTGFYVGDRAGRAHERRMALLRARQHRLALARARRVHHRY
ncbi:MAG: hypothetical protein LC772_10260 [Chloroflexi bacterium]|nr:hypothetical protein [Chloroflexota bacterium]